MAFQIKSLSTTDVLVGLPCISERVTGMPSGSTTSMVSCKASPDTAKYSLVGGNVGGRLAKGVNNFVRRY